jgi:hypothetical protein
VKTPKKAQDPDAAPATPAAPAPEEKKEDYERLFTEH